MVLHQITRTRPDAVEPVQEPTGVAQDRDNPAGRRVGLGRRAAGIALAAFTIPAVVAIGIVMQQLGGPAFIAAVTVAVVLGVGSYLLAGANPVSSMATPLLIMLIGAAMAIGELFLWIVIFIDEESSKAAKTAAGVAILAIPVITTILLAVAGRNRRKRRQRA